jgi:hypothetical protein
MFTKSLVEMDVAVDHFADGLPNLIGLYVLDADFWPAFDALAGIVQAFAKPPHFNHAQFRLECLRAAARMIRGERLTHAWH